MPRISPERMKRYRVDACYFGSMGVAVSRDAYLESLGGAEPSANKLPAFGDFPDVKPVPDNPKIKRRAPMIAAGRQLPFVRHVRACGIAKSLKQPPAEELDAAIREFDTYISKLNKALLDGKRYYARKTYEKDEFKRGKANHATLAAELPKLDDQLTKLGAAVDKWIAEAAPGDDKLDDAGKAAEAAVADARALTMLFLADEVDKAKVEEGIAAIDKQREALAAMGGDAKQAAHARVVPPKLKKFVDAATEAAKVSGKLTALQRYPVTAAMAELVEGNQRSLAQMLRKRGPARLDTDRARRLIPRLRPETARVQPRPTVKPVTEPPKPE